jgi:hypothetical protein
MTYANASLVVVKACLKHHRCCYAVPVLLPCCAVLCRLRWLELSSACQHVWATVCTACSSQDCRSAGSMQHDAR